MNRNFKGVIFDLDGTLLDSMSVWENVDRMFLEENGIVPPEGVSDIVKKMTIQDSAMYFKNQFSLEHSCEYIINRIEEMVSHQYRNVIPLKNGADRTIEELKQYGFKMCVATATYNSLADSALKRLGLYDSLDFVITCSDVGAGKDKPDIFFKAAEKMGCSFYNTVVVEDSLHCIETAADAGFFTIGVYDSTSCSDWDEICRKSDAAVKNISEITEIIKKG
ncbi:HAD family hydrolase [Porcipelethomonas sp.]|uniref:HAD family hydrolase n=1 Tax=Porcipelethomonas sp. TaxID=2981675 RepID=UPI003EFABA5E